ncbi:MAG: helix-hairpin-helix domain-containing protein [Desulfobulbaceae bacterium]|uniref:Helix-hairpin-helix domain-containing protein n=1 Tax=Candidatus Desulfatifera sulfidica TaxID=2841691 RepID=A0A8J6TEB7_9BACT|nr:helix-hairpin-helix domain-containing protein [Candidatus Desulfatifera sulfidica]
MIQRIMMLCVALLFSVSAAFAAVNVNVATQAELESVKGIGPAKAAAIIKHRTDVGDFESKGDLLQVKGVGAKLLEKISDEIEVKPAS